MNKVKIAYVGIDLFSKNLTALKDYGCEILEIFTCKTNNFTEFNTSVCSFADKNNIPITMNRITVSDLERLYKLGCDVLICAGYYYKIPEFSKLKAVNIHPSLLPFGKGAWPMPVAIMNGDRKTGITLHKISQNFDEGDIILQREIDIEVNENLQTLTEKLQDNSCEILVDFLDNFDKFYNNAIPQIGGNYLKYIDEEDFPINSETDYKTADIILRAFYGYECVFLKNGEKYGIICGKAVKTDAKNNEFLGLKDGYISCDNIRKL